MGKKQLVWKNWVVSYSGGRLHWTFGIWRAPIYLISNKICNSSIVLYSSICTCKCTIVNCLCTGTLSWVHKRYNFSFDFDVPKEMIQPSKMTTFILFFCCSWLEVHFFQLFVFMGGMRSGSNCWRSDVLNGSIRLRDCPGLSRKFADRCH